MEKIAGVLFILALFVLTAIENLPNISDSIGGFFVGVILVALVIIVISPMMS